MRVPQACQGCNVLKYSSNALCAMLCELLGMPQRKSVLFGGRVCNSLLYVRACSVQLRRPALAKALRLASPSPRGAR